jgi:hypothetical protein
MNVLPRRHLKSFTTRNKQQAQTSVPVPRALQRTCTGSRACRVKTARGNTFAVWATTEWAKLYHVLLSYLNRSMLFTSYFFISMPVHTDVVLTPLSCVHCTMYTKWTHTGPICLSACFNKKTAKKCLWDLLRTRHYVIKGHAKLVFFQCTTIGNTNMADMLTCEVETTPCVGSWKMCSNSTLKNM